MEVFRGDNNGSHKKNRVRGVIRSRVMQMTIKKRTGLEILPQRSWVMHRSRTKDTDPSVSDRSGMSPQQSDTSDPGS